MAIDPVLKELAARAPRVGVFLDLDGTLAPIVARPELTRILPEILPMLPRLAKRLDVVAVVSGRPSRRFASWST